MARTCTTREEWLNRFMDAARPVFAERGLTIPQALERAADEAQAILDLLAKPAA